MKNKIWWRLGLLIIIIGFFIVLSFKYFAFAGDINYNYSFDRKQPQMSLLSPLGRVSEVKCEENDCWQEIVADPVYLKTQIPISFDRATIELEYEMENQLNFELGIRDGTGVTMYTIQNDIFVELLKESKYALVDKDAILLQKEGVYNNIDAFLRNIPYKKNIATYNYDFDYSVELPEPARSDQKTELSPMVQGDVNAVFYLYGRDLELALDFSNTDSHGLGEEVILYRFESNKVLRKWGVKDNHLRILKTDLIPGTYGLTIKGSGSQILEKININTDKLIFDGLITLSSKLNQPRNIYTQAIQTKLMAVDEHGLQSVQAGKEIIEIIQREKWYNLNNKGLELHKISFDKGGVIIHADSVLAFDQQQYFNPKPFNFRAVREISQADIFDYLIADYQHPVKQKNGWYRQIINIDLSKLNLSDNTLEFVFSAPGIEENGGLIKITNIKVDFFREPISVKQVWDKIF